MCDCLIAGVDTAKPVLRNDCVPLDLLLEISDQVKVQWPRILSCESCSTNEQVPSTLTKIALRLLGFYEAALRRYSPHSYFELQRMSLPSASHQKNISPDLRVSSSSSVSTRNEMMLGKLAINEEESRMLVQLLLSDYLASLHNILNQVSFLSEETLSQWPSEQQIRSHQTLHETIDKVASLTGQLSFNMKKRKQSFGSASPLV